MPVQFTQKQMDAFDAAVIEVTSVQIANAAQALQPDWCAQAAAENEDSVLGFVNRICEEGYEIGLSKPADLAAFVAIGLSEAHFGPALPRIFAFIEEALGSDEPGFAILWKIEDRLCDSIADDVNVADMAAFITSMRAAV